jgi:phage antirepressor YoqD-like protein
METSIQIFNNPQFGNIRIATNEQGEPIFCLPDLCSALGLSNASRVKDRLDEGLTLSYPLQTPGGIQQTNFVTEPGFYDVVIRSDSPKAKPFRNWITGEVLPSIRKHGGYIAARRDETPEEIMARALLLAQETLCRQKQLTEVAEKKATLMESVAEELHRKNEDMKPKVLFADAVATSDRSVLVSELAKILKQNGVEIGQNRLFIWLREHGYLCSRGEYYNQPTQKSMELGLFEIKKTSIAKPDGTVFVTCTTKVTGKGQIYFINKFLSQQAA